ncbi:transmembrane domain-containing protein TMIGD3-like isoform X2 [Sparus aurata]|uniref:transmembrane domain-containing protein TMIGD3-like isoform X2 n=1 Tax=Sparus aurata TaxID=8175 RepID=UPI0011C0FDFD|nr:transmembrane domain-containing protein TMIGD3-like isoform X2 [Sparus aurata]
MLNDMLFFCKENGFTCEDIFTTKSSPKSNERFTLKETKRGLTISISHVSPSDAGVYWCGVERKRYRAALGQIQLEVKESTPTSPSAQNTASRSTLTIIIAVVVCAVVLVLVLILVFIYKRIQRSKNTRKEEAQNNKEDRTYEEIQERPQEPDSGTAIKTIYTTANFHTNPSPDIHYYSNSSFKNSSVEVSAGDPYSTVNNNDQHPTYSTVNHPSGLPDDPCYSTVNNPQQP